MQHTSTIGLSALARVLAVSCLVVGQPVRVFAQQEVATARQYLLENAVAQNMSVADVEQALVSDAYRSPTTGWYHVYFHQSIGQVEVYNRLASVVLIDGRVRHVTHNFVPNLVERAGSGLTKRSITPLGALQQAVALVGTPAASLAQVQEISTGRLVGGEPSRFEYTASALSDETIKVSLQWLPVDEPDGLTPDKRPVVLTWNVRFLSKDAQHSWNVHVDAESGVVVRRSDDVVHCSFGTPQHPAAPHVCREGANAFGQLKQKGVFAPNQYNVFDYPLEAPTFGGRTVVTSPYTRFVPAGTGPGATNGWHTDGTTSFTITRGNNVWAQEDANGNNGTGASPASATLDFNYPYTFGLNTAAGNQNAAITNLFYWNNLIHDVLWKYGFDEPSGNFQANNLGRGGAGNDFVLADAQDGAGINNANFNTPADGSSGRMQMFLWNIPSTYQPDGSFDNGIIAHEYGHGWSIRLTGGPANSNCLNNAEQGGEGWSDYLGLMLTTNWASLSANVASANLARGIGTYAIGQATNGGGIRPYRYSYDMTNVNGLVTYGKVGDFAFSQPHGTGSIWATTLWDMTWEIIFQDNQIVNDISTTPASVTAMRGNIAALKLVNEGLKLQPCSPSFVQARDAILQADQMLFAGRYRCAIARAFARRGLGANASTGPTTDDRLVEEQFTPITAPFLSSGVSFTLCSGAPFSYTATSATAGITYSWTRTAVAGVSNLASSSATGVINETLVNTTNEPVLVTYLVTLSPNTDPCGGAIVPQRLRVLVLPPVNTVVSSYSVCQAGNVPVGQGLVSLTALTQVVSGSIASTSPTYVRSRGNNTTTYTADGTVRYVSYTFVAPGSGVQAFAVTGATLSDNTNDTYLALYQNTFNPASPATNFVRGDDDSGNRFASLSRITHNLTAGTTYILVVSGYGSNVTGPFRIQATPSIFPITHNWFAAPAGGTSLASGSVFSPVGVAGSGVPNTATPGSTPFYAANVNYPTCRQLTTFAVVPTAAPTPSASVTITSGNSVTLTATGCAQAGSVLKWFQASTNLEVTMPVSPTATTSYYARCQRPSSTSACLSAPSANVTVTVQSLTSFDSATSGNWNVPGTWLCGCIPDGTLPVRILNTHTVTIPNAYTGQAKGVTFIGTGQIATQGTGKVNVIN